MRFDGLGKWLVCAGVATAMTAAISAEPLPSQLAGTWRITRMLPIPASACWTSEQAQPLVGSTISYRSHAMRWRGGEVPVDEVATHVTDQAEYRQEATVDEDANFAQLGLHGRVLEVNLQHDDADITGATTEVPGDTILMAGPNRIVVSACGVYYEAMRAGGAKVSATRVSVAR